MASPHSKALEVEPEAALAHPNSGNLRALEVFHQIAYHFSTTEGRSTPEDFSVISFNSVLEKKSSCCEDGQH